MDGVTEKNDRKSPRSESLTRTAMVAVVVYVVFYLVVILGLPHLGIAPDVRKQEKGEGSLELSRLIRQVKAEVTAATREMLENREQAMFQVSNLELEIQFVIKHEAGADAKLVPVGVDTKISSEKIQRIKLQLNAVPELSEPPKAQRGRIERPVDVLVK